MTRISRLLPILAISLCSTMPLHATVWLLDFYEGGTVPAGDWETIGTTEVNGTVTITADDTTTLDLTTSGFDTRLGAPTSNYSVNGWDTTQLAGWDTDQPNAFEDGMSSTSAGGTLTITFGGGNLTASGYKVEVINSLNIGGGGSGDSMTVSVGGTQADTTYQGADLTGMQNGTSTDWNSYDNGYTQDDYLIWNNVSPSGGEITITITGASGGDFPDINAIRLTAVPEPGEYVLVAGLGLLLFGIYRRGWRGQRV